MSLARKPNLNRSLTGGRRLIRLHFEDGFAGVLLERLPNKLNRRRLRVVPAKALSDAHILKPTEFQSLRTKRDGLPSPSPRLRGEGVLTPRPRPVTVYSPSFAEMCESDSAKAGTQWPGRVVSPWISRFRGNEINRSNPDGILL